MRPIPPLGVSFDMGFSLPVKHGEVAWNMTTPWGIYGSLLQIVEFPGMQVQLAGDLHGSSQTATNGTKFYELPAVAIAKHGTMVLAVTGLPEAPAWRLWVPRAIGIVVVLVMVAGLVIAVRSSAALRIPVRPTARTAPDAAVARATRRQALMDELVALEAQGSDRSSARREAVLAELEELWEQALGAR
jgi:hypothetical protein